MVALTSGSGGSASHSSKAKSKLRAAEQDLRAAEQDLRAHVPDAARVSCEPASTQEVGDVRAAIECSPGSGVSFVRYEQFDSADAMNQAYMGQVNDRPADAPAPGPDGGFGSCPYEAPYKTADGAPGGRLLCFLDNSTFEGTDMSGTLVVWTNDKLDILSTARRDDRDIKQLLDFWTHTAGPV